MQISRGWIKYVAVNLIQNVILRKQIVRDILKKDTPLSGKKRWEICLKHTGIHYTFGQRAL